MLDFSRTEFPVSLALYSSEKVEIVSSYPLDTLNNLVDINLQQINPTKDPESLFVYVDIDAIEKGTGRISFKKEIRGVDAPSRARRVAHKNNLVISTVRPNLRAFAILSDEPPKNAVFSTGFAILQVKDTNDLLPQYLYLLFQNTRELMAQMTAKMGRGQYPSINEADIRSLQIPVPPMSVQKEIIAACSAVDAEYESTRMSIETYREKIQKLFTDLDVLAAGGGSV